MPFDIRNLSKRDLILLKIAVWMACLWPLLNAAWRALNHNLGANPIEFITNLTGQTTLALLLFTLGVTPARKITGLNWLIKFRRLLGLFAFFYGTLHLTTYIWLDKFFDVSEMLRDVLKRPFITMGMLGFLLMVPLTITSTAASIRWLGGKRWGNLHKLTYISAIAGVIHFWWKVKADHSEPARYGVILIVLLSYRLYATWRKKRGDPGTGPLAPRAQKA